jgi:hypothetical protein
MTERNDDPFSTQPTDLLISLVAMRPRYPGG